jgi:hypothetical protein
MTHVAPPLPPQRDFLAYDDHLHRLRFRQWQILMTTVTVAITCWFMTFGVVSAILSIMIGKHVLVAILAAGLNLPGQPNASSDTRERTPLGGCA